MRSVANYAILAMVALGSAPAASAQEAFRWQPDIATAQQIATQSNRLVLVHFWAPWCKPCMKLDADVFSKPEVTGSLDKNFVCVKINVDESPDIAKQFGIQSLPTDVILSASGQTITQLHCPQAVSPYIQQINQVADGYRQLTDKLATGTGRVGQYAQSFAGTAQQALGNVTPGAVGAGATQAAPTVPYNPPAGAPASPQNAVASQVAAAAPVAQQAAQAAAVSAYSDDRYSDYFKKRTGDVATAAADVGAAASTAAAAVSAYDNRYAQSPVAQQAPIAQQAPLAQQPPVTQPPVAPQQSYMQPTVAQPVANYPAQQAPAMPPQQQVAVQPQATPAVQLPPGSPPLALDGYCAVQLKEQKRWVTGDKRWGAVHRGRTYLFTGPEEQKRFLASPDGYSPVIAGNDPVVAMDQGQMIPGRREHGVFYENRVYLFADETSLQRFYQNPSRYAPEVVQAMR